MRVLSLFSGVGGFDVAAEMEGCKVVAACEIDQYAAAIYRRHFPDVRLYDDARKINPRGLPAFDMLAAGFPCQPFSCAGKGGGFEDARGTLFFEVARIAQERRPRCILLENVKGLLSHRNGETARKIIGTLAELGYHTQTRVVDSAGYTAQHRERTYIVGFLGEECRREIFPVGEIVKKNIRRMRPLKSARHQTHTIWDIDDVSGTLVASNPGGVIMPDKKSGRMRRLRPVERERLQGLRRNYTKRGTGKNGKSVDISDLQRTKCTGNAVTVPVVRMIIREIMKNEKGNKKV